MSDSTVRVLPTEEKYASEFCRALARIIADAIIAEIDAEGGEAEKPGGDRVFPLRSCRRAG